METNRCRLAYGDRHDGRCAWCGELLPPGRRRWCRDSHGQAWRRNHVWSIARDAALDRDRHRCVTCGTDEELEVHHVQPVKRKGGYGQGCQHHLDNLVTLCVLHHAEEHKALREPAGTVTQLRLVA